jgi:hypothetical protein
MGLREILLRRVPRRRQEHIESKETTQEDSYEEVEKDVTGCITNSGTAKAEFLQEKLLRKLFICRRRR